MTGEFLCVFSDELLEPFDIAAAGDGAPLPPVASEAPEDEERRNQTPINGSVVHVTAAFGFHLSWLVYRDVMRRTGVTPKERGRE